MGPRPAGRVALMAIHPQYAEAILDGRKRVEFRKRPLAADVSTVVIYATTPVKRIVGEFTVGRTVLARPSRLWEIAGEDGAIDPEAYTSYFAGSDNAAGLVVAAARRYPRSVALAELEPTPAVPQSFTYLPPARLDEIRIVGGADHRPLLSRVAEVLGHLVEAVWAWPSRETTSPSASGAESSSRPPAVAVR